jgi:5-(carboxyamino)imidazole ribonucleotide synthase
MIQPGGVIGCLGGGQLGRMLGIEARRLGYGFHVFEPASNSPAAQVADAWTQADYHDEAALEKFIASVDVVTFEFENIPFEVLKKIAARCPVFPEWQVLHICQNREREKCFLREQGYPHAAFAVVDSEASLREHVATIGVPSVLKTADFGYDGKGQVKINAGDALDEIWTRFDYHRAVLEQWIEYELECSVVCARNQQGVITPFPVAENIHTNHILDFSIVPARVDENILKQAVELASSITEDLNVVGILGVELFVTKDGKLLVNELAPRTHNSGHYTIDACVTNQFEQQVRVVAGLPAGNPALRSPVVMVNILGDAWGANSNGANGTNGEPNWQALLKHPRTKLHLYGKSAARVGRKMGHFCVLADSAEIAFSEAQQLKKELVEHHG